MRAIATPVCDVFQVAKIHKSSHLHIKKCKKPANSPSVGQHHTPL